MVEAAHGQFAGHLKDSHHHCRPPLGKKMKTVHHERQAVCSPSPVSQILSDKMLETPKDPEEDYGEDKWDPHVSTKPSPLDGEALDEHWDPKHDGDDIEDEAVNIQMASMIPDLQDNDWHDQEWKPGKKKTIKQGQFRITHQIHMYSLHNGVKDQGRQFHLGLMLLQSQHGVSNTQTLMLCYHLAYA